MITRPPNLLTAIGLMALIYLALPASVLQETFSPSNSKTPAAKRVPEPTTPPPDLRQLFESANHADPTSNAAQLAIEHEQIQEALRLTRSNQAGDRRAGIEQLGAYPSVESEEALIRAFKDRDAGVREAAASILELWPNPGHRIIDALLGMARQGQEPQATIALETLSAVMLNGNTDPMTRQTITRVFKQLLGKKSLGTARRQIIQDALAAADPCKHGEFSALCVWLPSGSIGSASKT